ncbi:MAG: hypothetical protein LBF15_02010 [Candidatus Peribacteria bacterium]|jgi:ribosomal protein L25 (general stress protein Ctc)|nr:hypothetical protein [Candidatus Peribacteria bacterium]
MNTICGLFEIFILEHIIMEKKLTLKAQVRTADERARFLREERLIPGVVYGKHQDAISLKVDYSDFLRLFRAA